MVYAAVQVGNVAQCRVYAEVQVGGTPRLGCTPKYRGCASMHFSCIAYNTDDTVSLPTRRDSGSVRYESVSF